MPKHIELTVKGKVQGVSFRAITKAVADQLGIKGYVKNEANGDVFIAAEGDDISLDMFVEWVNEGPEHAEVTSVESIEGELKNYRNFDMLKR